MKGSLSPNAILYWSAAPLFTAGGAYFGALVVYWSGGPIFTAGGAYFGALAVYWSVVSPGAGDPHF